MIQRSMLSNRKKVLDLIYLHESALSLQNKDCSLPRNRVFMVERNMVPGV